MICVIQSLTRLTNLLDLLATLYPLSAGLLGVLNCRSPAGWIFNTLYYIQLLFTNILPLVLVEKKGGSFTHIHLHLTFDRWQSWHSSQSYRSHV